MISCILPFRSYVFINWNRLIIISDKDECASREQNECDPNALCTNTEGSYVCRCLRGYEGDGKTCEGRCRWILESCFVYILLGQKGLRLDTWMVLFRIASWDCYLNAAISWSIMHCRLSSCSWASKWLIAHVRHIKILTWLRGSLVIFLYLVWFSLGKIFFFFGN